MMTDFPHTHTTTINGSRATASDLAPLAFAGFAHFTAMQFRDVRVRGLDLHLDRLQAASLTLFGNALPDAILRAHLRAALDGAPKDLSMSVTMYSPSGEFTAPGRPETPAVLVRTAAPTDGPAGPLRLATIDHERDLPTIKHVGEVAKTRCLRNAVHRGFDDAAFVDRQGCLSEATIWNLAFWDGSSVVWPEAAVLPGVTMGILKRQLARRGIEQRHEKVPLQRVHDFAAAAVMNSWSPGVAVTAIGSCNLPACSDFLQCLHEAYRAEPAVMP